MVRLNTVPSLVCVPTIFALLISLILIIFQTDADYKAKMGEPCRQPHGYLRCNWITVAPRNDVMHYRP